MLNQLLKSVIDQDRASVVICDLDHRIVYMNPAAKENYKKRGGEQLVGQNLLSCHNDRSGALIKKVLDWFAADPDHNQIFTFHNEKHNRDAYMVALRDEERRLIGYYEKHEYRDRETAAPYDFK